MAKTDTNNRIGYHQTAATREYNRLRQQHAVGAKLKDGWRDFLNDDTKNWHHLSDSQWKWLDVIRHAIMRKLGDSEEQFQAEIDKLQATMGDGGRKDSKRRPQSRQQERQQTRQEAKTKEWGLLDKFLWYIADHADKRLTPAALAVLGVFYNLSRFDGDYSDEVQIRPGQSPALSDLVTLTGHTIGAVRWGLELLVEHGYCKREGSHGGNNKCAEYYKVLSLAYKRHGDLVTKDSEGVVVADSKLSEKGVVVADSNALDAQPAVADSKLLVVADSKLLVVADNNAPSHSPDPQSGPPVGGRALRRAPNRVGPEEEDFFAARRNSKLDASKRDTSKLDIDQGRPAVSNRRLDVDQWEPNRGLEPKREREPDRRREPDRSNVERFQPMAATPRADEPEVTPEGSAPRDPRFDTEVFGRFRSSMADDIRRGDLVIEDWAKRYGITSRGVRKCIEECRRDLAETGERFLGVEETLARLGEWCEEEAKRTTRSRPSLSQRMRTRDWEEQST